MTNADPYLLGHSAAEEDRLRRQVRELEPEARWLLDQLDLRPGSSAIDLGCGPEGILGLLAERVGPRGRVVGIGERRRGNWRRHLSSVIDVQLTRR